MNGDPTKAPAAFVVLCTSCGRQIPILISVPIREGTKPPRFAANCPVHGYFESADVKTAYS